MNLLKKIELRYNETDRLTHVSHQTLVSDTASLKQKAKLHVVLNVFIIENFFLFFLNCIQRLKHGYYTGSYLL